MSLKKQKKVNSLGRAIHYEPGEILNEETESRYLREAPVPKGKGRRVIAQCGRCGEEFEAVIHHIKEGQFCRKCAKEIVAFKNKSRGRYFTSGEIINKDSGTVFLHLVPQQKGADRTGCFKCGFCGRIYETKVSLAVKGCCCRKCALEKIHSKVRKYNPGDLIESKQGNYFLFLEEGSGQQSKSRLTRDEMFVRVNEKTGEWIKKPFYAQLGHVVSGNCTGGTYSSGEENFKKALDELKISYNREVTFPDLLSDKGRNLRFDFLCFYKGQKILVELDGLQHECPISVFGGEESFKLLHKHDLQKNEYVKNHPSYILKRITWRDYNKIDSEYVLNFLNEIVKEV